MSLAQIVPATMGRSEIKKACIIPQKMTHAFTKQSKHTHVWYPQLTLYERYWDNLMAPAIMLSEVSVRSEQGQSRKRKVVSVAAGMDC